MTHHSAVCADWQDISTAPKDEWILVYMPDEHDGSGKIHAARNRKTMSGYSWFIGHHFGFDCSPPSHWMPLPAAPNTIPASGEGGQ